ncbi:MAG: hypothetical protein KDC53_15715 [Saprospiraceae bacterium]|nr:hypothetical protein [Saprospiraceae bacterium]
MPSVVLYNEERPEIKISVTMRIRTDGSLEVSGLDLGSLVLELQGKSDYEYFLLVHAEHKQSLISKLQNEYPEIKTDADLLEWFSRHYNGNNAFSAICALMKRMDVVHDVSFW